MPSQKLLIGTYLAFAKLVKKSGDTSYNWSSGIQVSKILCPSQKYGHYLTSRLKKDNFENG